MSLALSPHWNGVLSSAYEVISAVVKTDGKSLTNKLKSSGPRQLPCGTPHVISIGSEKHH